MRTRPSRALTTSTFSARIPIELYNEAKTIAKVKGMSLNELVTMALEAIRKQERIEAFRRGLIEVSKRPEEMDVEYAFAAQSEVVLADED